MELSFNKNSPPYAPLALHYLSKSATPLNLSLAPHAATPSLTVPSPLNAQKTVTLTGLVTICRYLARRTGEELYESSPLMAKNVDTWLDMAPNGLANAKTVTQLAQKVDTDLVNKDAFLVGKLVSLADVYIWGLVKSFDKNGTGGNLKSLAVFQKWFANVDHLPECKQAASDVDRAMGVSASPAEAAGSNASNGALPTSSTSVDIAVNEENLMDTFREAVAVEIARLMPEVNKQTIIDLLEQPKQPEHGDFALALPRLKLKGNPGQIAKDLAEKFTPNQYIISASAIGPFLNFTISKPLLRDLLIPQILSRKDKFGTNSTGAGKTVVVEFSSPNIAKPFHAGHLRSTIIGNFVKNVCQANGMKTVGINYLGDWGKQYGLLAVGFEKFGSEAELAQDPIRHLFHVYVKINELASEDPSVHDTARQYFKKMEDGDKEALALWTRFRDLSIEKYIQMYNRLNVGFDVYSGESQVTAPMHKAMAELEQKKLVTQDGETKVIDLKAHKLGSTVVQTKDGTTLYITRDIGAAIERQEKYKFDSMYYIVGAQQDLHFKQLFKTLELMGHEWAKKCHHINFGMVKGMKTRTGNVVFLEDILVEASRCMHEVMKGNEKKYAQVEDPEAVADEVGLSAVKIQDMQARRIKDYKFDWSRMTSFEGDTGPYLQYAHARLCSIERNFIAGFPSNTSFPPPVESLNLSHLTHPKSISLLLDLARFPDLIRSLPGQMEPCVLIAYLFSLCHKVSVTLEDIWVMGQEEEVAKARCTMYWCARVVVGNGLRILGLRPLERM